MACSPFPDIIKYYLYHMIINVLKTKPDYHIILICRFIYQFQNRTRSTGLLFKFILLKLFCLINDVYLKMYMYSVQCTHMITWQLDSGIKIGVRFFLLGWSLLEKLVNLELFLSHLEHDIARHVRNCICNKELDCEAHVLECKCY